MYQSIVFLSPISKFVNLNFLLFNIFLRSGCLFTGEPVSFSPFFKINFLFKFFIIKFAKTFIFIEVWLDPKLYIFFLLDELEIAKIKSTASSI